MRKRARRARGLHPFTAGVAAVLSLGWTAGLGAVEGREADSAAQRAMGLGPAPRLADGRFQNPGSDPATDASAGAVDRLGWGGASMFLFRRITGRFREATGIPPVVANDGSAFLENPEATNPTVTWVGHSTLLVRMAGLSFLTDPIWSDVAGPTSFAGAHRFVPPGLAIDALPPLDFVVVSHGHYDHMDLPTLVRLAERGPSTQFLVPLGNGETLRDAGIERVVELDWGESVGVGDVEVVSVPAHHWSRRGLFDANRALWSGWVVLGPERRFYYAGDSAWFDGFERIGARFGPFDLAAVPVGAYEPAAMMLPSHLDPEHAVRAARAVRARRMLAVHYGTFDLADEPLDEPPRRFLAAAAAAGVPAEDAWTLAIGESRHF